MADDVAMNFRKAKARPAADSEGAPAAGISTTLLVIVALAIGFGGYSIATGGVALPSLPAFTLPWKSAPAVRQTASVDTGPRAMSVVPGVRETTTATTGLPVVGSAALAMTYAPVGPVVIRKQGGYVEVDGPRLLPPPIGPRRSGQAILDHGVRLANELRNLAYTPCDSHLRHLAAANINLFVAGFMPPRSQVDVQAGADAAFWRRTEASVIRRAVAPLAEKGVLAPADFGLDASPQARGLFDGMALGRPTCA